MKWANGVASSGRGGGDNWKPMWRWLVRSTLWRLDRLLHGVKLIFFTNWYCFLSLLYMISSFTALDGILNGDAFYRFLSEKLRVITRPSPSQVGWRPCKTTFSRFIFVNDLPNPHNLLLAQLRCWSLYRSSLRNYLPSSPFT